MVLWQHISSQEAFLKNSHGYKIRETRYYRISHVPSQGVCMSLNVGQGNKGSESLTDLRRVTHPVRDSNSSLVTHNSVGGFSPLLSNTGHCFRDDTAFRPSMKIAQGCYDPWGKSIFWMKGTLIYFFTSFTLRWWLQTYRISITFYSSSVSDWFAVVFHL